MKTSEKYFEGTVYFLYKEKLRYFLFGCTDSPGIPPSAHAHELFRGFSFIAPALLENEPGTQPEEIIANHISLAKVGSNKKKVKA